MKKFTIIIVAVVFLAMIAKAQNPLPALDLQTSLGWIPIQQVTAGETLELDLRRFFFAAPGDAVRIVLPEKMGDGYEALVESGSLKVGARTKANAVGLYDIPLQFFSGSKVVKAAGASFGRKDLTTPGSVADVEKPILETVLTLEINPREGFTFKYRDSSLRVREVAVAGDFNKWDASSHRMTKIGSGEFELFVPLRPGVHPYLLMIDGEWDEDHNNYESKLEGDDKRVSIARVGLSERGDVPYVYAEKTEQDRAVFRLVEGSGAVKNISAVLQAADGQSKKLESKREGDHLTVEFGDVKPGSWIRVAVADEKGNVSPAARIQPKLSPRYIWQDAIVYYALVDRFANGEADNDRPVDDARVPKERNFQGGDLQGLRQKIEDAYFRNLGINTLCLSPLHRNVEDVIEEDDGNWSAAYHGRWPVAHTDVDERVGGEKALSMMVKMARERGLFVMTEWELSRAHREHSLGDKVPGFFEAVPDEESMIRKVRLTDGLTPRVMVEQALEFAIRTKIDGYLFRSADVASHQFWSSYRTIFNAASGLLGADTFFSLGQSEGTRLMIDSFVGPNMLNAQEDLPLYETMVSVFAAGSAGAEILEQSLSESEAVFGKEVPMARVLGGPDLPRFASLAEGAHAAERLKMAMTLQLTIDGVPILYYGDEVAMTGREVPENRRMMTWEQTGVASDSVRGHWEKLASLRREHPALRYGSRRPLMAEDRRYSFVRAHLDDRVLVAWNLGELTTKFRFSVKPELDDGIYEDRLGGETIEVVDGMTTFLLPPMTSAVYVRTGEKSAGEIFPEEEHQPDQ